MNNDQDTFLVMEARTTSQLPPEEESARVDYDILLRRKIAELQEALEICKTRPVEAPVSIPNLSVIKESKAAEKRIAKLRELIAYKKLRLEEKAEYELLKAEIEQANQEEEEVDGFVVHPHEDEQGNVDCDYRERFVKPLQQELCELEQRNTKLREEMHNYRYFLCERARDFYSQDPNYPEFDIRDSMLQWIVQPAPIEFNNSKLQFADELLIQPELAVGQNRSPDEQVSSDQTPRAKPSISPESPLSPKLQWNLPSANSVGSEYIKEVSRAELASKCKAFLAENPLSGPDWGSNSVNELQECAKIRLKYNMKKEQSVESPLQILRAIRGMFLYIQLLQQIEGVNPIGFLWPKASIFQVGYLSTPLDKFIYNDFISQQDEDGDDDRSNQVLRASAIDEGKSVERKLLRTCWGPSEYFKRQHKIDLDNGSLEWAELSALDILYLQFNYLIKHFLKQTDTDMYLSMNFKHLISAIQSFYWKTEMKGFRKNSDGKSVDQSPGNAGLAAGGGLGNKLTSAFSNKATNPKGAKELASKLSNELFWDNYTVSNVYMMSPSQISIKCLAKMMELSQHNLEPDDFWATYNVYQDDQEIWIH